jgi:hypothetical protein
VLDVQASVAYLNELAPLEEEVPQT